MTRIGPTQTWEVCVGTWPTSVPDALRVDLVCRGSLALQNKDGPFPLFPDSANKNRSMKRSWFYRTLGNGEQLLRTWLVYSPLFNCLQCFCCRLFGNISSAFGKPTGFGDWSKLNPRIHAHEEWVELRMRLDKIATIDSSNQEALKRVVSDWQKILTRILDCIRFLSIQNLVFRGHREVLSSNENSGNFLELVKFLGNYDPVVREHLTRIQAQPNTVSYLSPAIQNEFISILGQHVLDKILDDIREAKYYSIMFDSTPDLAHDDQMSQVIRYVKISDGRLN